MSIIESVREYMAACPLLEEIPVKSRFIDWTSPNANNYGIIVDGEKYARNYTAAMEKMTQEISEAQAENTEKLKSGWDSLNHAYAIGVITSDEESL